MMWFSVPEAAKMSGLLERRIRRAAARGDVRSIRLSQRRTVVYWPDIEEFSACR